MSNTSTSTDIIRRVFSESNHFVEVGPFAEDTDCVELRSVPGEKSADFWGLFSMSMTKDMAAELGNALLAASKD